MKIFAVAIAGLLVVVIAAYLFGAKEIETNVAFKPSDVLLVESGKRIYADQCASCHGAELEGEANWREPLPNNEGLRAPPHDETGHTWHHPDAQLFAITKFGGQRFAPTSFKSNMPAFEELLSDEEIIAVLSFIKSTWPKQIQDRHDGLNKRVAQN